MDHFPVFLKLQGTPCLVVGGGVVAERKVRLLLRAGAAVTVVAPELTDTLRSLETANEITQQRGVFREGMLARKKLVIAATDDEQINKRVFLAAEAAGIFCNAVDDNDASSFIVPAIVDRSPVVVAIGTGGNAPVLAQALKSQIEAWLPTRIGELARRAGRWRPLVKKRFATLRERRRFWQRFFHGPIAAHLLANRQKEAERALRLELMDDVVPLEDMQGEAYIVGAGPGDPGLVTIRAQQLISRADIVLYDRLVSAPILDFARKDAELISVGKQAGGATTSQDEINNLIVAHVKQGKRVCRLKGGDPFVFGRGGEEAQALADAGLSFQIVPGISAALGCAAYAGIPLTHRGMSGSVTFATARLDGKRTPDWAAWTRPEQTLVLYMGVGSVAETTAQLTEHGRSVDTPVAIIENGTTEHQRVLHGTLATIAKVASNAAVRSPAVLIIGETARFGKALQWFSSDGRKQDAESSEVDSWLPELQVLSGQATGS